VVSHLRRNITWPVPTPHQLSRAGSGERYTVPLQHAGRATDAARPAHRAHGAKTAPAPPRSARRASRRRGRRLSNVDAEKIKSAYLLDLAGRLERAINIQSASAEGFGRSIWFSRYLVFAERADHFFAFRALVASFHEEVIGVQCYGFPLLE
jgi:hypothetical protein